MGIILNRPTDARVADYLPNWEPEVVEPCRVFEGGPVQREVAIGLGRAETSIAIAGWVPVTNRVGLFDLGLDPSDAEGVMGLRVFSGYAGWSQGQLESEIATGGWLIVDSEPDDAFNPEPDLLWRSILGRQPGWPAAYAHFPHDPKLN